MAYIYFRDGKVQGPYPYHKGEYCGNNDLQDRFCQGQDLESHNRWLARMRFGLPRPCAAGSTEQLKSLGYVGLYLKDSDTSPPVLGYFEFVETPPELMEPGREHEYNNGGKPGLTNFPKLSTVFDDKKNSQSKVKIVRFIPDVSRTRPFYANGEILDFFSKEFQERNGQLLEVEHVTYPIRNEGEGDPILIGKKVFITVLREVAPQVLVESPVTPKQHRLRGWMTSAYHKRIQKKWNRKVHGQTCMTSKMEKVVLSIPEAAFKQLKQKFQPDGRQ